MDLNTMESKCSQNLYGGIEEFQADAENIFHNIMICYGENPKMTGMILWFSRILGDTWWFGVVHDY